MDLNSKKINPKAKGQFDNELLERFYQGRVTPAERELLEEWFIDLDHRLEINQRVAKEWERTPSTGSADEKMEEILYKIHYHLRLNEYKEEQERIKAVRLRRVVASVAVGILLIISGVWLGSLHGPGVKRVYSELHAPYGSRLKFDLPDGTTGWLNSGSSLKYPVRFTGRKRTVSLEGEGFFVVKPDHARPFIVQTQNARVVALGTSFNVQAYKDNVNEEITLVEGKVVIEKKLADNSYKHVLVMQPGQHVRINVKTGKVLALDQDSEKYVAWKDGRLVFRNDPLSRVVKEMERFYNVEIEVTDSSLYKYHFHATFEDETLFESLRLLTLSSAMDYEICKREKNPDGTFQRRKVILYKKKR